MSTFKINIINKKNAPRFEVEGICTNADGFLENFNPRHIVANGWDCRITRKGEIRCECTREYSDGWHVMLYVIRPNGSYRLTLDTPDREAPEVLRKGYVVPKGVPVEGLLGLSGGYVDSRYAYFREASFQKLMNEAGVTAINHENPNRVYSGRSVRSGWGTGTFKIETDGKIVRDDFEEPDYIREQFNAPGANPNLFDGVSTYEVENATWVVEHTHLDWCDNHTHADILYTEEKDVRSILKRIAAQKEK